MASNDAGKTNPCGAYLPDTSQIDLTPANSKCNDNDTQKGLANGGRGQGFCCDMMSRIDSTAQWVYSYDYVPFVTAFAVGGNCKGCPNQVWRPHLSKAGAGTGIGRQPCKGLGGWKKSWHQCYFGLDKAFGCTNPNSYGIVLASTPPGVTSHPGSPNGTCTENCMQLTSSFYIDYAVAGVNLSMADYPPTNFRRSAYFDCEPPVYDSNGSAGASGSKLIYVGYSPRVITPSGNDFNVKDGYSTEVSGVNYKMIDNYFSGYLPANYGPSNAWGGKTTFEPTNTDPHLWNRKSSWNMVDPQGPKTSFMDFDGCCTFVSFGCKDPNFGSYSSQAQLNCDGVSHTNQADSSGNCQREDGSTGICYDGLNCNACIDDDDQSPNYNSYYPVGDPNIVTTNYDPQDSNTCYQETWDACGGGGTLSQSGWNEMETNRPFSDLYGDGLFWAKGGENVTNSNERPLCQCNNQGCTLVGYDNYSSLNTLDCTGGAIDPNGTNDVSCCIRTEFGCTDSTYNNGSQNNYFCTLTQGGQTIPQNASSCMDPDSGAPCFNGSWTCGPGSGVTPLGGVPISPQLPNGTFITTNPTITVIDDGSCENTTIPGCLDDGGILNGGTWPTPLYPGYSSLNFNANATTHVQVMCIYAFGCVDSEASNPFMPVCGSPNISLVAQANQVNASPFPPDNPINATFVENNLIPDITCCRYLIPGEGEGCTDPNALNYNPIATEDDGTCIFNNEGCTDPTAINFNPNATLDDGSCIYSLDFPEEGNNFLDGSLVQLCREPLVKEEVLMNVCQPTEIQSEVFIERGKQSVFETNQRLGEVRTIGGLMIYGYGFYNIKEQI